MKIKSISQIEALPTGSVIEENYKGYKVLYTRLESGNFEMKVLAAPNQVAQREMEWAADSFNTDGGMPVSELQDGLNAGTTLTVLSVTLPEERLERGE